MELTTPTIFAIGVLAFICEYVDATLGMGYGTILTPLLLLLGLAPLQVVPAVLFSQFLAGLAGGFWHHRLGNVSFDFRRDTNLSTGHPAKRLLARLGILGYLPRSRDAKVVYVLGGCGIIGALAVGAVASTPLSAYTVKRLGERRLRTLLAIAILALGAITLAKIALS